MAMCATEYRDQRRSYEEVLHLQLCLNRGIPRAYTSAAGPENEDKGARGVHALMLYEGRYWSEINLARWD